MRHSFVLETYIVTSHAILNNDNLLLLCIRQQKETFIALIVFTYLYTIEYLKTKVFS